MVNKIKFICDDKCNKIIYTTDYLKKLKWELKSWSYGECFEKDRLSHLHYINGNDKVKSYGRWILNYVSKDGEIELDIEQFRFTIRIKGVIMPAVVLENGYTICFDQIFDIDRDWYYAEILKYFDLEKDVKDKIKQISRICKDTITERQKRILPYEKEILGYPEWSSTHCEWFTASEYATLFKIPESEYKVFTKTLKKIAKKLDVYTKRDEQKGILYYLPDNIMLDLPLD